MKSQCTCARHHGSSQKPTETHFSVISCDSHWPEERRCLERILATSAPSLLQVGEAWEASWVVRVDGFGVHEADITPLTWPFKRLIGALRPPVDSLSCVRRTCGWVVLLLRPVGVWMYKRTANGDTKFTERAQLLTPVRSSTNDDDDDDDDDDERLDFLLPRALCTCGLSS